MVFPSSSNTSSSPFYLSGTDIRADQLSGLREPQSSAKTYSLGLRHARRSASPLMRLLVDPVALSGSYNDGTGRTALSLASASSYALNADYALTPGKHTLGPFRVSPTSVRLRSVPFRPEQIRSALANS